MSMTDDQFGWWLAGLVDGEGHFGVPRIFKPSGAGPYYRCVFRVALTVEDRPLLETACRRTGWGKIYEYDGRGNQKPYAIWTTDAKAMGCVVDFFERYPLQSKKARDFEIWKHAARAQAARIPRGNTRDPLTLSIMAAASDKLRSLKRSGS